MKALSIWMSTAAILVAVGFAGSAWSQSTTESNSTVTTVPAEPSVTSRTVTNRTEVSPPVVVAGPRSSSSRETTTTNSDTPNDSDSVRERTRSDTTYGPDGVTHSESQEKTSSD